MNQKTIRSALRIMLAMLLVAGTVISLGCSGRSKETASEVPMIPEMFWGRTVNYNVKFTEEGADYSSAISYAKYQTINLDGQDMEMTAVPLEMSVNPESGRMRMLFGDRFQTLYCLEGIYAVEDDVLTFRPEAVIDAIDADWAKTAQQKNAISPESLSFDVAVRNSYLKIFIDKSPTNYVNYIGATTKEYALQGTLSAGSEPYKNIVEINAPMPSEEDKSCRILFEDGSFPTDSKIGNAFDQYFSLSWGHVEKDYNGRREEFTEFGNCSIYYLDTRPYGFICIDKDGKKAIRYQDPLKTLGE